MKQYLMVGQVKKGSRKDAHEVLLMWMVTIVVEVINSVIMVSATSYCAL